MFPSRFVFVFFLGQKNTKQTGASHTRSVATTTATPAEVNARDNYGNTKIFLAAAAGDAAEVARLLELKADFELPTTHDK